MADNKKEMTEMGPIQRIGDYLEACIHRIFTDEADYFLQSGKISRDERILLSSAIGQALDKFHEVAGDDLLSRPLMGISGPPALAEVGYRIARSAKRAVEQVRWLLESKIDFDESAWNGAASQWDTPAAYCSDCLIDLNGSGEKTKDKCHLPYRKPGSNKINKNALRAIGGGARGISALKGVPAEEKGKAARWVIRYWKAAFDRPAPDSIYRLAGQKPPTSGEKSSTLFFKDKDGGWRVVLLYSNKYEDRDNDILTEEAHKEFSEWVNTSGFKPQITLFHMPSLSNAFWSKVYKAYGDNAEKLNHVVRRIYKDTGWAIGEAERVVYMNGFAVMVGKVYEDKYPVAEKLATMKELGNSHLFLTTDFSSNGDAGMIVNKYRSFEGTILPRQRAANMLTLPIFKENDMAVNMKLTDSDKQWLGEVLGEDDRDAMLKGTASLEKELDTMLSFKAAAEDPEGDKPAEEAAAEEEEAPAEEDAAEETAAPAEEPAGEAAPEDVTKAVTESVMKALNVEGLQAVLKQLADGQAELQKQIEALKSLQGEVAEIKKSEDEKVAEKLSPVNWMTPVFHQPSQAEDNQLSDKKAAKVVKEAAPKLKDAAERGDPDNPLNIGLWNALGPQLQQHS